MSAPSSLEWTRSGSPWSSVPVAEPLWFRFTPDERQALREGRIVHRGATGWRCTEQADTQLELFGVAS